MSDLFPYQKEGAKWLATKSVALLADEMGLGKSAQSIVAADVIGAKRITVLCPAVARINWIREFRKFSRHSRQCAAIETGTDSQTPADVRVSSYSLASQLSPRDDDLLILDEVHFLKSVDSWRSHVVLGKGGLVERARRIYALSGTPAPNNPSELYPLLRVFGILSESFDQFVRSYCTGYQSGYGGFGSDFRVTGAKNVAELRARMAPILLRRKKSEVLTQMPSILYSTLTVEPGPVDLELEFSAQWRLGGQHRVLETVARQAEKLAQGWDIDPRAEVLASIADSVPMLRRYVGLQKVAAVAEMVAADLTARAYDKIVIFAIHRGVIEGLRARLARFGAVTLYGGTNPETRQRNIDKFQNLFKCQVFIGNVQAAGTAINLTSASQVLFVESSWVPGENAQAAARCHRIGQTEAVNVRFVSIANSIDEAVQAALARKAKMLTELFD